MRKLMQMLGRVTGWVSRTALRYFTGGWADSAKTAAPLIGIAGVGILVFWFGSHVVGAWEDHKRELVEQGKAECRGAVAQAAYHALEQAYQKRLAEARDRERQLSELERSREEDARRLQELGAEVDNAHMIIDSVRTGDACARPDTVIDAINRMVRDPRPAARN